MCNYTNKTKNMCAKIVGGISLLLCIIGVVLVIMAMGARNMSSLPKEMTTYLKNNSSESDRNAIKGFSGLLVVFGIIIIVISLLGCGTAKMKKPYLAIPFGLLIIILSITLIAVGLLTTAGSELAKVAID